MAGGVVLLQAIGRTIPVVDCDFQEGGGAASYFKEGALIL